jgi:hypothetical protein
MYPSRVSPQIFGLVPAFFRPFVAAKFRFYACHGKAGAGPGFGGVFDVTKTSKTAPWAFPKQACVDTYPSHPGALPGLPSQEASGRDRSTPQSVGRFRFGSGFSEGKAKV